MEIRPLSRMRNTIISRPRFILLLLVIPALSLTFQLDSHDQHQHPVRPPHDRINNPSSSSTNKSTFSITFDALTSPPHGISSTPYISPNKSLTIPILFSGFSLFRPDHPDLEGLISENDVNCATSAPNAVLGSRYRPVHKGRDGTGKEEEDGDGLVRASFGVVQDYDEDVDDGRWLSAGKRQTFELVSLSIKPMDFPSGAETTVTILGYPHHPSTSASQPYRQSSLPPPSPPPPPLKLAFTFPPGYHIPVLLDIEKATNGVRWTGLVKVEVYADYGRDEEGGYEGLDWEFCVDDIVLGV